MSALKNLFRAIFRRRLSKTFAVLTLAVSVVLIIGILVEIAAITAGFILSRPPDLPKIAESDFFQLATDKKLGDEIILREQSFLGKPNIVVIFTIKENGRQKYWNYLDTAPVTNVSPEGWLKALGYHSNKEVVFPWGFLTYNSLQILGTTLSGIGMMAIFIWFIAGGGIKQALEEMSILRTSKKMVGQKVTLDNVAGIEPEKKRIKEIIQIMKSTESLKTVGAQPPRGIFLFGPPGTGKSLLARAIVFEAGLPFFWMSGSDFASPLVGIATQKADTLFEEAFRAAPSIIVIDEIDSAAPQRAGLGPLESKERNSLVNKLLSLHDRIEKEGIPVYVIGITNFPEAVDQALLREGRFDEKIEIPPPMTIRARRDILEVCVTKPTKKPLADDVDLNLIASQTDGLTGASLAALVNKAALRAVLQNRKIIIMEDFEESIELVLMGPIRELAFTEKEQEIIARHEAGHTLANWLLPDLDPPQLVSLLPRGKCLGFTWTPERREYWIRSKSRLLALIKSCLGGYVVEKLIYGETSSSVRIDIELATSLANQMVREYGMSDLGPISFGKQSDPITSHLIEQEKMKIIRLCEKELVKLFSVPENREKLLQLSGDLSQSKRLDYNGIIKSIGEPPPKK